MGTKWGKGLCVTEILTALKLWENDQQCGRELGQMQVVTIVTVIECVVICRPAE